MAELNIKADQEADMPRDKLVVPYSEYLKNKKIISIVDESVTLDRGFFLELMEPVLSRIRFDPDFYRNAYEDIRKAEDQGLIRDLHRHFLSFGFFENRLPSFVEVEGGFYAREYPDIAVAIIEGRVASAQKHFETVGYAEGRIPRKGWSFKDLLRD